MEYTYNNEEDGKLIFSPQVAKYLLRRNFQIVDIIPHRDDRNKTVFVFKQDERILEAIDNYKSRNLGKSERSTDGEKGVDYRRH